MNNRIFLTRDEQAVLKAIEDRFYKTGKASTPKTLEACSLAMKLVSYGRLSRVKSKIGQIGYAPRFRIAPKRDFPRAYGTHGFYIEGKWVNTGFVVTDGFRNIMPAATWFRSIEDAMDGLETLIQCKFNADAFWEAWRGRFLIAQVESFNRG